MQYSEVGLEEMLLAREKRAALQRELLFEYGRPLLSFTMNIPGPVKRSERSDRAFAFGQKCIEAWGIPMQKAIHLRENTGLESIYVMDCTAAELKKRAEELEELPYIGRLFDLDVLDEKGEKLSRAVGRSCLVCGGPAAVCARSRAHGLSALQKAVEERLLNWEKEK